METESHLKPPAPHKLPDHWKWPDSAGDLACFSGPRGHHHPHTYQQPNSQPNKPATSAISQRTASSATGMWRSSSEVVRVCRSPCRACQFHLQALSAAVTQQKGPSLGRICHLPSTIDHQPSTGFCIVSSKHAHTYKTL